MSKELLQNYLSHEFIEGKYNIKKKDIPVNIKDALSSDKTIVSTIATIVNMIQNEPAISDKQLATKISQHLNNSIL
jgi:hypothetical protein